MKKSIAFLLVLLLAYSCSKDQSDNLEGDFTVSGKLVKTIQEEVIAEGYRVTGIEWDGTDDFGNPIGRGVYVYKVSIGLLSETNQITTSASEFQKLVILK